MSSYPMQGPCTWYLLDSVLSVLLTGTVIHSWTWQLWEGGGGVHVSKLICHRSGTLHMRGVAQYKQCNWYCNKVAHCSTAHWKDSRFRSNCRWSTLFRVMSHHPQQRKASAPLKLIFGSIELHIWVPSIVWTFSGHVLNKQGHRG